MLLHFLPPDADGEKRLLVAFREDDIQVLHRWLEEPRDPNSSFQFLDRFSGRGFCALHGAARFGSVQCLCLLLEADGGKDAPCNEGFASIHTEAQWGQLEAVRFLVEHEADVSKTLEAEKDKSNHVGETPLWVATAHGHTEIV